MSDYSFCFYRFYEGFDLGTVNRVLSGLERADRKFFPLTILVGPSQEVRIETADDFRRECVPAEYQISPNVYRVPFRAANGVAVTLTDSKDLDVAPANLVLEFSKATYVANGWNLGFLAKLSRELVKEFSADLGYLYQDRQRSRTIYGDRLFDRRFERRPLGVFWVNFFGFRCDGVKAMPFRKVMHRLPLFEELPGQGYLFSIQEELYEESASRDRRNQEEIEGELFSGWLKD